METSHKKTLLISTGIILLILLAGWYFIASRSIDDTEYNNVIGVSEDAFNAGNVDLSITELEELLTKNLSSSYREDVSVALASAYAQKGSLEFKELEYGQKAVVLLDSVIQGNQTNSNAFRVRAYAYEIMQNYAAAIDDYTNAIRLDQKNAMAYSGLGHAYDLMGDSEKAILNLQEAVRLEPRLDHTLYNLSRIYFKQGETEQAAIYAQKVLEVSQNNRFMSEATSLLGLIQMKKLAYKEAAILFEKAVSLDGALVSNYVFLADAKLSIFTSDGGVFASDFQERKKAVFAEVSELLNKARAVNQNYTGIYLVQAKIDFMNHDKDATISTLQTALSLIDTDITLGAAEKEAMRIRINDLIKNYSNVI